MPGSAFRGKGRCPAIRSANGRAFVSEDASSGQRKARREARRKARLSGGRAFSACSGKKFGELGIAEFMDGLRYRLWLLLSSRRGFTGLTVFRSSAFPSTVRIHNGGRFASPRMDRPYRASCPFRSPGALRSRSLSMSSTATFWDRSKLSASHGIAKCRSPRPRNPPNERMA